MTDPSYWAKVDPMAAMYGGYQPQIEHPRLGDPLDASGYPVLSSSAGPNPWDSVRNSSAFSPLLATNGDNKALMGYTDHQYTPPKTQPNQDVKSGVGLISLSQIRNYGSEKPAAEKQDQ